MSLMTERERTTTSADLTRPDGTPVRVLVVDDEPNLAEVLSSVLRHEGWDVRSAGTGLSAVRTGREFRPDAIVLDMTLPDFDGLGGVRRLRNVAQVACVRCARVYKEFRDVAEFVDESRTLGPPKPDNR